MRTTTVFLYVFAFISSTFSFGQTQAQLDSMERLIPKKTGKDKVLLLNDLTFYYFQTDTDKAIKFGEQSLAMVKAMGDKQLLANTCNDLSMPYMTKGNYKKAIELNLMSLTIRKSINDSVGIMSSYGKLGTCYFELTNYTKAQHYNNLAIKYAKALKDELMLLKVYQNSANVLEFSGSIEQALTIHRDIQKLARKLGANDVVFVSLGNMGSCYRKLKRYDESRKAYFEAKKLIDKSGDHEKLALVYQGLGVVEREVGNNEKGLKYYLKAYDIYEKIGSKFSTAILTGNIGNVYCVLGKYDSASVYLHKSLDQLIHSHSYRQISNAYGNLAANEKRRGDYKQSVKYFELQNKYKDSVVLFQGSKNQAEMFAKYQLEKKEREIAENKVELAENKAKIAEASFESLMLTSVSVTLILLFIVVFLYFRSKRKQARAELVQTRKEEKLLREQQLNEQKLEISRELHDNIGSQITYMISSMDNLAYVDSENEPMNNSIRNISEFGRETMQDLRSTIWAMNAEDGSLDALVHKLEELRSKVQLPIEIQNKVAGNPELKATEMLNMYRIIQEAIQNSLKYAEASEIRIIIDQIPEGLRFEILDNGKGFDSKTTSYGNGIMNMKHRSGKMNAVFEIVSEPGKGTSVICLLQSKANVVLNMGQL